MYGLETCRGGLRECDILNTALVLLIPVRLPGVGSARSEVVVVVRRDPALHQAGNAVGQHGDCL